VVARVYDSTGLTVRSFPPLHSTQLHPLEWTGIRATEKAGTQSPWRRQPGGPCDLTKTPLELGCWVLVHLYHQAKPPQTQTAKDPQE
jgi:hypothetical protein